MITLVLDKPVYLAGFGKDRRAETFHDDLHCPVSVVHAAEGLAMAEDNSLHPKYKPAAKRFILFGVSLLFFILQRFCS